LHTILGTILLFLILILRLSLSFPFNTLNLYPYKSVLILKEKPMFMKKATIKLASAFLMLSLMSTCLNASEFTDEQDTAAIKIQIPYRDKKLKKLFENIETEAQTMSQEVKKDPANATVSFNNHIGLLGENSTIRDILTASAWCFAAGSLAPETAEKYNTYLEAQRTCEDPLKRQLASSIKAFTIQNINEMKEVLQELETSKYPFFQMLYYGAVSKALSASEDIDQAQEYLMRGLSLPKHYHVGIYGKLADLDSSEGYAPKRKFYLKEIIKLGTPKQVAKATYDLASLSGGEDALSVYTSILTNPTLLPYLDSNAIQLQIATLFAYDSTIHDEARATEMYKTIRLNRESVKNPDTYWNAGHHLVNIYMNQNEYSLALDLVTETLNDPKFPEWRHKSLAGQLIYIVEHGPESMCDTIDESEPLKKLIDFLWISKGEANGIGQITIRENLDS